MAVKLGTVIALIQAMAPKASPEVIESAVSDWLDEHPEATTTVEDGSITEAKLAADLLGRLNGLDRQINGESTVSINLFNPNDPDILDNQYINGTNGEVESLTGYMETGFIECEAGDTFTFYNSGGYLKSTRHIAYYNSSKQYVTGSGGDSHSQMPTITVPNNSNIAFFRIAMNKNHLTELMIVKNDTVIHEYVPYGGTETKGIADKVEDLEALTHPWRDKAVVLFGDSIMYNDGHNGMHGYPHYLEPLGFETITNKGENGACIAYHSERSSYKDICTSVDEVIFTGYDLVVIEGGINDYLASSASPIGALVNSTNASDFNKTTFIGALQYVITTILNAKATIKIALFTPLKKTSWYNENSQGKTLIDYANAMKEVAEYYSIPVLDYFAISGFNMMNLSEFTSDGLHPNNDGYEYICQNKLVDFIRGL